jgi:hypothetical protein
MEEKNGKKTQSPKIVALQMSIQTKMAILSKTAVMIFIKF